MDRALYIAGSGASANLKAQATLSHNLANANSTGFKASIENTFAVPFTGPGLESRVATTARTVGVSDKPGMLEQTGNTLDIALQQDHWLTVQDGQGGIAYTRAGDLRVNANGQLLTGAGHQVMDNGGQPLAIPPYQSIDIGQDGTISMIPEGQTATGIVNAGQLGVVAARTRDMVRGDDGLFRPAGAAPAPATGAVVTSGVREGSNVDAANALVSMIELSRSFEMQVRVLQAGDETAKQSNSLLSVR